MCACLGRLAKHPLPRHVAERRRSAGCQSHLSPPAGRIVRPADHRKGDGAGLSPSIRHGVRGPHVLRGTGAIRGGRAAARFTCRRDHHCVLRQPLRQQVEIALDLLEVVEGLWQQGVKVWVDVYSSYYPPEAAEALAGYPHLRFRPTPHSTAVPGILKGADILFHTESFDPTFRPYVRLSVSSKSQIYMLSRVPVLMYGPPEVSVVAYARETGGAYVVDRPDRTLLREEVVSLGRENELRERLVKRAIESLTRTTTPALSASGCGTSCARQPRPPRL